ncbi:MAG: hypothetical protein J7M14_05600, partial [Planctomycetes bacterium]|nr:hypothetical protein [Planctomycetota bacterium]
TYAEGEYNHPMSIEDNYPLSMGMDHWRNWTPSTYYCTHALAPLMYITDTMPVSVNGLSIPAPEWNDSTVKRGDPGSVILCRMNNDAVFRLMGIVLAGHSNWYRVHGLGGAMECTRGPGYFGPEQVRVWHEEWNCPEATPTDRTYVPDWPEHAELANKAGHGGGDFWTNFEFANAIRSGKQPFLDVYRGVAMSSVGILAWKSALEEGAPFAMPDWRKESSRKKYEDDHWSPFPDHAGPGQPPASIRGEVRPSAKARTKARRIWKKHGYSGG